MIILLTELPLKHDTHLPAKDLQTALKTPLKQTLLLPGLRNVCQAIVSYLYTVFKAEPLLRLPAYTLCNYFYQQTPNYQLRCAWAVTAGGVLRPVTEQKYELCRRMRYIRDRFVCMREEYSSLVDQLFCPHRACNHLTMCGNDTAWAQMGFPSCKYLLNPECNLS